MIIPKLFFLNIERKRKVDSIPLFFFECLLSKLTFGQIKTFMFYTVFSELSNLWKDIKKDTFSYIFIFFQLVYFTGLVRQFTTDASLLVNCIFTMLLCIVTRKLRITDGVKIFIIITIYTICNLIPISLDGIDEKLFFGYIIRLCTAFFILIYLRDKFLLIFESITFLLAFISLPLFFIQLVHVQFFDIFDRISSLVLNDEALFFGRYELSGHRYIFIFLVNSWGKYRNSGFMWEPAAFAGVLAWAIVINVIINHFKMNIRLIILLIALLMTFSLGGYIYLMIFVFLFLVKNYNKKNAIVLIFIIFAIITVLLQMDFIEDNITMLRNKIGWEKSMTQCIIENTYTHEKASRIGGFIGNINIIFERPFGVGTNYNPYEYGLYHTSNGLVRLIGMWGISSLIIIASCSYYLVKQIARQNDLELNPVHITLMMLLIIMPIAGNPFYNQPFFLAFILNSFFIEGKRLVVDKAFY